MDIEFVVQDIYSLTRPQWKFAAALEEATKALHIAIVQDQKTAGIDRAAEVDEATSGASSDDDNADVDDVEQDGDGDEDTASEDDDIEVRRDTHEI
jgi:regulator of nonsense transcripts 2